MPEVFTDNNGNRVIIRHKGPAGVGIPEGGSLNQILQKSGPGDFDTVWATPPAGTGAAVGPASSVNSNITLFDGTTGKLLKDSGVALSSLATVTNLALKQNAVSGKGLSQEDFTTIEKEKLVLLKRHFRGTFTDFIQLSTFDYGLTPPVTGDYAIVNDNNTTIPSKLYVWDSRLPGRWTQPSAAFLGSDVASALFDTDDVWDQSTCRIFTSADKSLLAAHESLLSSIPGLVAVTKAYGSIKYFDIAGSGTAFTVVSPTTTGSNNTYPLALTTTLGTDSAGFTSNGLGRLTHTGNTEKVFQVIANLTCEVTTTRDVAFSLAKNGGVVSDSLKFAKLTGSTSSDVTVIGHVRLGLNEYVDIYFGNITTTDSLSITSMSVSIVEV